MSCDEIVTVFTRRRVFTQTRNGAIITARWCRTQHLGETVYAGNGLQRHDRQLLLQDELEDGKEEEKIVAREWRKHPRLKVSVL